MQFLGQIEKYRFVRDGIQSAKLSLFEKSFIARTCSVHPQVLRTKVYQNNKKLSFSKEAGMSNLQNKQLSGTECTETIF